MGMMGRLAMLMAPQVRPSTSVVIPAKTGNGVNRSTPSLRKKEVGTNPKGETGTTPKEKVRGKAKEKEKDKRKAEKEMEKQEKERAKGPRTDAGYVQDHIMHPIAHKASPKAKEKASQPMVCRRKKIGKHGTQSQKCDHYRDLQP